MTPPHSAGMYFLFGFILFGPRRFMTLASSFVVCRAVCMPSAERRSLALLSYVCVPVHA